MNTLHTQLETTIPNGKYFIGAVALNHAAFGEGTRAIVLDNVICRGNETSITSCRHYIPSDSDYHSEDAGVRCRPGM